MEDSNGLVLLVRQLTGAGLTQRSVHVVPLPIDLRRRYVFTALCGAELRPGEVEQVDPGVGQPCTACLLVTPLPQDQP